VGPRNDVLHGGQDILMAMGILWFVWPTEKRWESLLRYIQQKLTFNAEHRHDSGIAAADCNAPDWFVSH